uniref:Expressed protein n=1 Tax=Echinococcus granulosus TaxID=6210 RepID=A0A068WWL9_ECHGR|nr:expressed protein [Echinococcus granulosus]
MQLRRYLITTSLIHLGNLTESGVPSGLGNGFRSGKLCWSSRAFMYRRGNTGLKADMWFRGCSSLPRRSHFGAAQPYQFRHQKLLYAGTVEEVYKETFRWFTPSVASVVNSFPAEHRTEVDAGGGCQFQPFRLGPSPFSHP